MGKGWPCATLSFSLVPIDKIVDTISVKIRKPITQEQFLAEVDAFCKRHDLSDRAIGKLATKSSHFMFRLRAGYSPSLSTVERVYDFMIAYEREHGR